MDLVDDLIRHHGFALPPFAFWSTDEFRAGSDASRIVDARMGWDITVYVQRNFNELGLFLFTLRNGSLADLQRGGGMVYAEKLMISRQDQISPMHTHVINSEDIINRGGATMVVGLFGSDNQGNFAKDRGGMVLCDGIERPFGPGEKLMFAPGGGVTLMPGDWHAFCGDRGRWADWRGLYRQRRCD